MNKIDDADIADGIAAEIAVTFNGRRVMTAARLLSEFVAFQDFGDTKIATALNGNFVPATLRATTVLAEDDNIEIVSARQGG